MSVFINGEKIIDEFDWAETAIGTNLAYGLFYDAQHVETFGNTSSCTITATPSNNWCFAKIQLNTSFKKGDVFTISALASLTGPKAGNGSYKATIYSSDTNYCYDNGQDSVWLTAGKRSSKEIVINRDMIPDDKPVLLLYSGVAGQTAGNTITAKQVKVERGSIATQWSPSPLDVEAKFNDLQSQINQLKKQNGGGK